MPSRCPALRFPARGPCWGRALGIALTFFIAIIDGRSEAGSSGKTPDDRQALQSEINRLRKELRARERELDELESRGNRPVIAQASRGPDSRVLRNYKADTPTSSLDRAGAFRTAILATQFTPGARISAVAGTGSMEPVFGEDAYLLLEPAPFESLREGDIVTYRVPGASQPVVHRLVRRYGDKFVAKGDNNAKADTGYITRDNYLMRVFGIVYTRAGEGDLPSTASSDRTAFAAPASPPAGPGAGVK